MALHLNARDGDLLLITDPALLMHLAHENRMRFIEQPYLRCFNGLNPTKNITIYLYAFMFSRE